MFPKMEFGSFYKFMSSLGVLVLFIGLALPWLVLRALGSPYVTQGRFDSLTPESQELLRKRQSQSIWISDHVWFVAVLFVVVGLIIALYGLAGWRRRQEVSDEKEDTERDQARLNFTKSSDEQVLERIEEEVRENLKEGAQVDSASPSSGSALGESAESHVPPPPEPPTGMSSEEARERILATENRIFELLDRSSDKARRFYKDVQIVTPGSSVPVDMVATSKSMALADVAIDVSFVSYRALLPTRVRDRVFRLAVVAATDPNVDDRSGARGVAIVVSRTPLMDKDNERLRKSFAGVQSALKVTVGCLVVDADELARTTPDEFREAFERAARDPRTLARLSGGTGA